MGVRGKGIEDIGREGGGEEKTVREHGSVGVKTGVCCTQSQDLKTLCGMTVLTRYGRGLIRDSGWGRTYTVTEQLLCAIHREVI